MNESMNETLLPPAPKRGLSEGVVILIGVLAFCVLAVAFLAIDPFRWNVVGNLKMLVGLGGDPVIASIPANTKMYIGIDLLNAQPDKLNRVVKPFAEASGSATKDTNAAIQDLDKQLKESAGVTFSDDIMPWIGKTAGMSIQDIQLDKSGAPQKIDLLIAVQSRDNAKADAFLKKIKDSIESKSGKKLTESTYANITIYSKKIETVGNFTDGFAFARSGDVVLLSMTDAGVQAAIDAQKGDSLAKDKAYLDLAEKLPKDRMMMMYMAPQKFIDMYMALIKSNPSTAAAVTAETQQLIKEQYEKIAGMGMSLTMVEAGLQMDVLATYIPEKMTAADKSMLSIDKSPLKTVNMLPENALVFAGGRLPTDYWKTVRDQMIKMGSITQEEYDESMKQFEKQFKFNPDKDLLPYLGGEMMLAVMPSSQGLFQEYDLDLGLVMALESTDPAKMSASVDKLAAAMPALIGAPLDRKEASGLTYYNYKMAGAEIFAIGAGKPYLLLGTSGGVLENLFASKSSLASSARYQTAIKTLPSGTLPTLYLDMEGMLGNIRESMPKSSLESFNKSTQSLKPMTTIVAGNSMVNDSTAKFTLVLAITPVK